MKKVCTILVAFALVLSCVAMVPAKAQAATASDLVFALNADGKSYCVTDCNETASGSLIIPATYEGKPVTSIGNSAFRNCSGLTEIVIPESVQSIGNAAFSYCSSLKIVNIPDGVTAINSDTFYKCFALTGITIPESVLSIAHYAFYYCTSLTEITIPASVRSIGEYAFACCTALENVNLKAKLTKISDGTFFSCKALRSVIIPDGVTTIGEKAFDNCLLLINIGIPDTVTGIGLSAFDNFQFLRFVYYCGTDEQWSQISIAEGNANLSEATRSHHRFVGSDCTQNMTCEICGETGPAGHSWIPASCTEPQHCSACGVTVNEALGHAWKAATCTEPKTCTTCGETEGEALGHTWKAATCTTPKTCTVCGLTEGDIQHTYANDDDNTCDVCGNVRILSDSTLNFLITPGLSFQDYIGMQILISNAVAQKYDRVYVTAVQADPAGDVTTTLESVPYMSYYQLFEQQVLSWSMTEKVTMTLYAEKNGKTYMGQSVSTSVEELALEKLADYTAKNNTKAVTALVDMVNYGAAVQRAFNHNASSLPNTKLGVYADKGTATTPTLDAANTKTGTGSVAVVKDSISMQAKVEIQLLFAVKISDYTVKATVGGTDVPVVVDTESMGAYGWTIVRVAVGAAKMRDTFTIALYDAEGNPVTQVYNVSVEAYGQPQLGGTYNDVVIAMMRYGDSVAAI